MALSPSIFICPRLRGIAVCDEDAPARRRGRRWFRRARDLRPFDANEGIVVGSVRGTTRRAQPVPKKTLRFKGKLAHPKGVEPLTPRFVVQFDQATDDR